MIGPMTLMSIWRRNSSAAKEQRPSDRDSSIVDEANSVFAASAAARTSRRAKTAASIGDNRKKRVKIARIRS